ncbi:MAG: sialate O-acetylesterase [bacterium]|nr:sialate O-acetylesterase [bacterium]
MRLSLLLICAASLAAQTSPRIDDQRVGDLAVDESRLPPVAEALEPVPSVVADVVVLIGQSNALGYGRVQKLETPLRQPLPGARIWRPIEREWQPVHAGQNSHDLGPGPFFGCEVGIADSVAHRGREVWIIKFAVSATAMGPYPGEWNEWNARAGELYLLLTLRLDAAARSLRALGYEPRVRLVAISQGETDSVFPKLAVAYEEELFEFCTVLRQDLRRRGLVGTEPPMIRLALVSPYLARLAGPGVHTVRRAQLAVASQLARCQAIATARLELRADGIHFAASGLVQLGRQFAAPGW